MLLSGSDAWTLNKQQKVKSLDIPLLLPVTDSVYCAETLNHTDKGMTRFLGLCVEMTKA